MESRQSPYLIVRGAPTPLPLLKREELFNDRLSTLVVKSSLSTKMISTLRL